MKLYIGYTTAAYAWLMARMDGRELDGFSRCSALNFCPATAQQARAFDTSPFEVEGLPIHVMVPEAELRCLPSLFTYHVCSFSFPDDAFVDVGGGLRLASPELCFLQMGTLMSLAEQIKLGNALCALHSYAIEPDGRNARRAVPLTTVARLRAFVLKAKGSRGYKQSLSALKHVVERVASPIENILAMLLCLPKKMGGYGFPKPIPNCQVPLSKEAAQIIGYDNCYCDLGWPDCRLDVEYDSDFEHTGSERIAKDARRRNALQMMGYQVNVIGRIQFNDVHGFDSEARAIAKALGVRFVKTTSQQMEKKIELRKRLVTWSSGAYVNLDANLRVGDCGW